VTFMPLYLQVVKGSSPTASGLEMLTMMGGVLVTSIGSGQLISRTGRYKIFPIVGTALMAIGLFLMSLVTTDTPVLTVSLMMLVLGLGLGMVMQVLVIAVQNAVDYSVLGVATSGATLFRLIGGSLGTAIFGMLFATGLASNLSRLLPAGSDISSLSQGFGAQALTNLPPAIRDLYLQAFTASLSRVFLIAVGFAILAFILTLLLKETPLKGALAAAEENIGNDVGQAFVMPVDVESEPHLLRGLALLADRNVRRRYIESIIERSGVDLSTVAAWLLIKIENDPSIALAVLSSRHRVAIETLDGGVNELLTKGLIETGETADRDKYHLTDNGCEVFGRLADARRKNLAELVSEWSPEQRVDIADALNRIARELVPDTQPRSRR
jgi:MFS family permease